MTDPCTCDPEISHMCSLHVVQRIQRDYAMRRDFLANEARAFVLTEELKIIAWEQVAIVRELAEHRTVTELADYLEIALAEARSTVQRADQIEGGGS